jgi:hypothetical protein
MNLELKLLISFVLILLTAVLSVVDNETRGLILFILLFCALALFWLGYKNKK